jgi:tetrapyrrole methylase family protein/MazG family protein
MDSPGITLLGLGPGDPAQLTRQAWQLLETLPEIYLRTRQHPTIQGFPPALKVHSFDDLYEHADSFEYIYAHIIEQVLTLGQRPEGVVYAVPGHPFIAETTCPEIARRARLAGIPLRVIEGLSFIEATFTALNLDPLPQTVIVDALLLAEAHVPTFPPDSPALIAQIHSSSVASDVKLTLMEIYPDEHPVQLIHAAGTAQQIIESLPLYEIDRSPHTGLLTSLYIPPLARGSSIEAFQELIAHLRAPDGCPWDQQQTHQTLRQHLLEETYEALEALDAGDGDHMREEFGDLLLQIVLHAQIANESGVFNISQVIKGISDKIIRRHPHVFGDWQVDGVGNVLQNWEKLKAVEREQNGESNQGLLDGVALALPALTQAQEIQSRAARVGFDWPEIQGVVDKICEECAEFLQAEDKLSQTAELGDIIFAIVNLARRVDIDAESALRETNLRFRKRFAFIESSARQQGRKLSDLTLDEMEILWQAAKKTP